KSTRRPRRRGCYATRSGESLRNRYFLNGRGGEKYRTCDSLAGTEDSRIGEIHVGRGRDSGFLPLLQLGGRCGTVGGGGKGVAIGHYFSCTMSSDTSTSVDLALLTQLPRSMIVQGKSDRVNRLHSPTARWLFATRPATLRRASLPGGRGRPAQSDSI